MTNISYLITNIGYLTTEKRKEYREPVNEKKYIYYQRPRLHILISMKQLDFSFNADWHNNYITFM